MEAKKTELGKSVQETEKTQSEESVQEAGESELELHPETAKYRQDTYSSLTDLNGIDVFSEEFQKAVERVLGEENRKKEELENKAFVSEIFTVQGADEELEAKLFLGEEETVLRHDYEKEKDNWSVTDIGMVLFSMLAVAALYLFFFQDRKARKK